MKSSSVAIGLGWFSVGLGLTELFAGRGLARRLGLEHRTGLVRLFGVREVATGIGILAGRRTAAWLWARVVGDVLDIAVLGSALNPRNEKRDRAAVALTSVLGITLLDIAAGAGHAR
jgi:hypothetical protein